MPLLIQAIRSGNDDAFERLMAPFLPKLRQLVTSRLDTKTRAIVDPDDVLQEILITVHRELPGRQFEDANGFSAWLDCVARSRVTDVHRRHNCLCRKRSSTISLDDPTAASVSGSSMSVGDQVVSPDESPSSNARRNESSEDVRARFSRLPPKYAEVLTLWRIDSLTIEEIAKRLGKSVDAVRKTATRAFKALGGQSKREDP